MRLGVDFSAGVPTLSTTDCWKANGVEYAVVQYDAPSEMQAQMNAIVSAGIELQVYVYVYNGLSPWGQTPAVRVQNCLNYIRGFPVTMVWVDCEDTAKPFQPEQIHECVRLIEAAGYRAGIYTGRWVWVGHYGNPRGFGHLPLWHAQYLGEAPTPDLSRMPRNFDGFQPYGGWLQPAVWQFWNTTTFCGHSVDLNAAPDIPDVPSGPWQPSKEEAIDALIKAGAVIIAGDQNLADLARVHRESLLWIAKAANP